MTNVVKLARPVFAGVGNWLSALALDFKELVNHDTLSWRELNSAAEVVREFEVLMLYRAYGQEEEFEPNESLLGHMQVVNRLILRTCRGPQCRTLPGRVLSAFYIRW